LEIKDLENYENDFKSNNNKNNWNNKSYTMRHKEEINRKKSLLSLYSNSNNGNFENYQFSYSERYNNNDNTNNEMSHKDDMSNCLNSNEDPNYNVFNELQNLKVRTQGILEFYAKKFNTLKSNGTI